MILKNENFNNEKKNSRSLMPLKRMHWIKNNNCRNLTYLTNR